MNKKKIFFYSAIKNNHSLSFSLSIFFVHEIKKKWLKNNFRPSTWFACREKNWNQSKKKASLYHTIKFETVSFCETISMSSYGIYCCWKIKLKCTLCGLYKKKNFQIFNIFIFENNNNAIDTFSIVVVLLLLLATEGNISWIINVFE